MTTLEKFGLLSGIIGLIADLITLSSLAFGLVIPPPQFGFWANTEVLGILTLTLIIYSISICLVFLFQLARNRWQLLGRVPSEDDFKKGTLILGYGLWLPVTIIWAYAMLQILNNSTVPFMATEDFVYVVFIVVAGGGYMITELAVALNRFFTPETEHRNRFPRYR